MEVISILWTRFQRLTPTQQTIVAILGIVALYLIRGIFWLIGAFAAIFFLLLVLGTNWPQIQQAIGCVTMTGMCV